VGSLPGVRLIGSASHRAAVLSFVIDGIHPHDAGAVLDDEGIAVRAGHHCAQPLMRHFGVPATIRASFACYNTPDEVEALTRGLARVREVFG
jgi:cysteine desulfurase/selenocysteine lyase